MTTLGFRTRLTITIIALVAATVLLLGAGAWLLVAWSLRTRLIDAATQDANFDIGVLAPARLPQGATRLDLEQSPLVDDFRLGSGDGVYVAFAGDAYASGFTFNRPPPTDLAAAVETGELAYRFVEVEGRPYLLLGGRLPPDGPDFYFYRDASFIDATLGRLAQVLAGAGLGLTLAGAAAARRVARRVLRPVADASAAAEAMAQGDLTVRLPAAGDDEFGTWAAAFNRMAASLEAGIEDLRRAESIQRRFVADVSHELRTPLAALVNEAAMLRAHLGRMPAEAGRLGQLLVGDVTRLRLLVEDLLEVSRLDAESELPRRTEFDPNRLVAGIVSDRLPRAISRLPAPGRLIVSDPAGWERIVGNLVDNAARHAPGSPVEVEAAWEDGAYVLSVADRGPGIPDGDLDRIFDRFYKADPSRSGGGSGLGLAIARQHARRLGGELTAHHRPGGGLVFRLAIPVTDSLPDGDDGVTSRRDPADG